MKTTSIWSKNLYSDYYLGKYPIYCNFDDDRSLDRMSLIANDVTFAHL